MINIDNDWITNLHYKKININENFAHLRQNQTTADILIIYFCQIV